MTNHPSQRMFRRCDSGTLNSWSVAACPRQPLTRGQGELVETIMRLAGHDPELPGQLVRQSRDILVRWRTSHGKHLPNNCQLSSS